VAIAMPQLEEQKELTSSVHLAQYLTSLCSFLVETVQVHELFGNAWQCRHI